MSLTKMWQWLSVNTLFAALLILAVPLAVSILLFLHALSTSHRTVVPKTRRRYSPTHLLIVLGSGGHTAEMLSMLRRLPLDPTLYTYRTYVVSSGDGFSASKVVEFEKTLRQKRESKGGLDESGICSEDTPRLEPEQLHRLNENFTDVAIPRSYIVITIPRARRVHQSFWTAPFTTVKCFWACLNILRGVHVEQRSRPKTMIPRYPDLILTNGPATGVCIVLAAKLIRLLRYVSTSLTVWHPAVLSLYEGQAPTPYPLRTVFIESWARVTSLSLSGKILLPFADRFLVQWPSLRGKRAWRDMKESEFVGTLVE